MKKSNVILIISSVVMLMLSAVTLVFAWFTIVEKTQKIIVYSGKIELFYLLEDTDNDEEIDEQIIYEKLVPGDSFNYKLTVKNLGNIDANVYVVFTFSGTSSALLEAFTINYNSISENFTSERTVINGIKLRPNEFFEDDVLELEFSVIFNPNYENFSSGQYVKIEKITIILEQDY